MHFSIIMPLYNMEHSLAATLEHFCGQNLSDAEIICIDDASTDNTCAILADYSCRLPIRLLVLPERVSPGEARNYGIRHAVGTYLLFCDGDDRLDLEPYREISAVMEEKKCPLAFTQYYEYDQDTNILIDKRKGIKIPITQRHTVIQRGQYLNRLFELTNCACWNKIMRRKFVVQNALSFPDLFYIEDMVFLMRVVFAADNILCSDLYTYQYTMPRSNPLSTDRNSLKHPDDIFIAFGLLEETMDQAAASQMYTLEQMDCIKKSLLHFCVTILEHDESKLTGSDADAFRTKALHHLFRLRRKYVHYGTGRWECK